MSIGSILLGLSLFILVGLVLAQPFLSPQEEEARPRSRKQMLLAQKEATLEEIRALDFDYETNKLPEPAYQAQRTHLMEIAAETLKALDELGTERPPDDVAAQIEAAINRVRAQKQDAGTAAAVPANGRTRFCPQCGSPVDAADKFCGSCGHKLAVPA